MPNDTEIQASAVRRLAEMLGENDLTLVHASMVFASECGRIEQRDAQRLGGGPLERRRQYLKSAKRILACLDDGP